MTQTIRDGDIGIVTEREFNRLRGAAWATTTCTMT